MKTLIVLLCLLALAIPLSAADGVIGGQMVTVSSPQNYYPDNQFLQPKAGKKLVAFEIVIQNIGSKNESYNPYYFTLKDSQSYTYTFTLGKEPYLGNGDLPPSDKVRGFITFEVPAGAGGFSLIYKPNMFSSEQLILRP